MLRHAQQRQRGYDHCNTCQLNMLSVQSRAVGNDHFCDTTKGPGAQRLPPPFKQMIPLYHRSGDKPLDPTTLVQSLGTRGSAVAFQTCPYRLAQKLAADSFDGLQLWHLSLWKENCNACEGGVKLNPAEPRGTRVSACRRIGSTKSGAYGGRLGSCSGAGNGIRGAS